MENASKALLISAAILIAILIISLMMVVYNEVSDYYAAGHEEKEIQQLKEFNEIFDNYNRENIRGTDMLSLMNRIIDYNERLSYEVNKQYPRMRVSIDIRGHVDEFRYEEDFSETIFTGNMGKARNGEITNKLGADGTEDEWLRSITEVENDLISESEYLQYNLDSTKLQRLSAEVSNIMLNPAEEADDSLEGKNKVLKRKNLIENILKQEINDTTDIDNMKKIACKYYEFTQFKRALFNCTEVIYDQASGRIQEMNFVVKTKNDLVEFD